MLREGVTVPHKRYKRGFYFFHFFFLRFFVVVKMYLFQMQVQHISKKILSPLPPLLICNISVFDAMTDNSQIIPTVYRLFMEGEGGWGVKCPRARCAGQRIPGQIDQVI